MKNLFLLLSCLMLLRCNAEPANALSENLTVIVLEPPINQAVQQVSKNGFVIGFRLVCINAASDTVIDKIFTEGFNSGDPPNEFRKRIGAKMQDEIDAYQARHDIFSSAAFDATPAIIQSGLDGGVL